MSFFFTRPFHLSFRSQQAKSPYEKRNQLNNGTFLAWYCALPAPTKQLKI